LLVVRAEHHEHRRFWELPELLRPGDLLVLNDTRVIPARLFGEKDTGGRVEVLLLEARNEIEWLCLVKPGRRLKPGSRVGFADGKLFAEITGVDEASGGRWLRFEVEPARFWQTLAGLGRLPLPPYITRSTAQPEQYQTVWAKRPGAVAAPTAGLHFTEGLLERLDERGIVRVALTLHVGMGTFRPVQAERVEAHTMHGEWLDIPHPVVEAVERTRKRGGRVVAVGTTSARALETAAADGGTLQPGERRSELFIYPGYRWRAVDGLVTNFHLPRSSLLMLVSSLVGRERLLGLYREAIETGYRFYSFGDAMLILP
jgi:S-adenosylmethionine:tRNA ribosyltransferase-isomerase